MTARRVIVRRPPAPPPAGLAPDTPEVLGRVYGARAVTSAAELDYALGGLAPVTALKGVGEAAELLHQALAEDRRILVVGDFDVDGATSSALMVAALTAMGGRRVDYLVPNRFAFGYGLSPGIVAVAAERGAELIVTVDNGIASLTGVDAARERGIPVIVTDHHLPGERLPAAAAIVNPNQPGCPFPSKALAGVGVAFYLMAALRSRLRALGWFRERALAEPNLADYLDLVALGTVADMVPLDRNNRLLVAQGLERIRAGRCRPGVMALARVAGRDLARLACGDLGYALGPRLNAAGRLDDMAVGIACLLAPDLDAALPMAAALDDLNRERRAVEAEMHDQAVAILEGMAIDTGSAPPGVCLFDPGWHEGVIGILASRVKERLNRPVIAFAPAARDGAELKGSARSIPGLHIRDVLAAVDAAHPGLVVRFGGHAMAAGLTLEAARLEPFTRAFQTAVGAHLDTADLEARVYSDGPLAPGDLTLDLAEALRRGGPWGQGFPEPVFDGEFQVLERRVVGDRHLKLRLRLPDPGGEAEAIAFNHSDTGWPPGVERVRLAYRLDANEFRGTRRVQLVAEYLEPLPP